MSPAVSLDLRIQPCSERRRVGIAATLDNEQAKDSNTDPMTNKALKQNLAGALFVFTSLIAALCFLCWRRANDLILTYPTAAVQHPRGMSPTGGRPLSNNGSFYRNPHACRFRRARQFLSLPRWGASRCCGGYAARNARNALIDRVINGIPTAETRRAMTTIDFETTHQNPASSLYGVGSQFHGRHHMLQHESPNCWSTPRSMRRSRRACQPVATLLVHRDRSLQPARDVQCTFCRP